MYAIDKVEDARDGILYKTKRAEVFWHFKQFLQRNHRLKGKQMLSKFLNPKNDVAFKKIFGTDKNKDILIHFLNDIIHFKEQPSVVVDVKFLDSIQDPETIAKKMSIVDILCTDQNGSHYIVEMQVAKVKGFEKRAQYYASKAYISQANNGGEYSELKEIIFLAISDYVMFPYKKNYISDHVILDLETHENDLKDFSYTFLELPKFTKTIDQLEDMTDKWLYFFKHANEVSEIELPELIGNDYIIKRAFDELNRFYWNEKELLTYDQATKHQLDYQGSLAQKFDEGETQGIEKGKVIGKAEGIVEGKAQGRAEGIAEEKANIAKSLLLQKFPIQAIHQATGLSIEVIKSLEKTITCTHQ